jgi:osmotically-inducible protein OsmY
MDDLTIKKDVEAELAWEPSLNAASIGVAVKDGIVTLTGRVTAYAEKMVAARAATRVTGVKAVANEIEIGLLPADQRTDEEVARSVANALAWNTSVPSDSIKAVVSQGWVTLEGTVEWYYQKEAAERAVRYLRGVKGVTNKIVVKPVVTADVVKAQIEAALKRSAELDARQHGDFAGDCALVGRAAGGRARRLGRPRCGHGRESPHHCGLSPGRDGPWGTAPPTRPSPTR